MPKTYFRMITETKQHILEEFEIAEALARGVKTRGTPRDARDSLLETFKKFSDGKFIQAGKRTYRVDKYAEMVARTNVRAANSLATIRTTVDNGYDLVRVSDHNTDTEVCIPYEDNIYSISGTSKKYPKLDRLPPWHPNCLHVIFPYVALEAEVAA